MDSEMLYLSLLTPSTKKAGVLKQKSTVRKIKPLGWISFSRLNMKRPKSGCFSKCDEGDSNYTRSTGDGLMGVQLLSTTLDTKSETISVLKKLSRWLNWHQETRGFFFFFAVVLTWINSKSWGLMILAWAIDMNTLAILLDYGVDYQLILVITQFFIERLLYIYILDDLTKRIMYYL